MIAVVLYLAIGAAIGGHIMVEEESKDLDRARAEWAQALLAAFVIVLIWPVYAVPVLIRWLNDR